ncbi:MAG TPA: adenylate/guanylate cyclase domain-containing protein [Burkholderiales bacterium]|nr:adenylate/guanylate cyclase domain-containing protein [Burkholderiales bacterium]
MTLISKERAILFADVSGSTALYELLGDKPAAKAIEAVLGALREVISARDGVVVKTIGDEVMVVFNNPQAACEAAREMQQRMATWPLTAGAKLAIRIGFHFGLVLEDKGDFWGDGVNTAARLAGLAKAGQILTTGATANALPGIQRSNLRDLDAISVKGKHDAVRVFELMWGDTEDATHVAGLAESAKVQTRLTLEVGERTIGFPRDKSVLILGRENTCDIVVQEKTASRLHARIERKGVQYVLVDESTNGTYVAIEGDREVLLRRDSVMLRGRGKFALGTSTDTAVVLIQFDCS